MANFFDEIKDSFKERVTNPFIISFIIAWSILHWNFLFTLMNFDSTTTLDQKIDRLNKYFHAGNEKFLGLSIEFLWIPVGYALLGTISYYLFSNVSRLLANISRNWLNPFVDWLINRNEIATRDSLKTAQRKSKKLQDENEVLEVALFGVKEENKKIKLELEKEREQNNKVIIELTENPNKKIEGDFYKIFNGNWKKKLFENENKTGNFQEVSISVNNSFFTIDKHTSFQIRNLFYDKKNDVYSFLLFDDKSGNIIYSNLVFDENREKGAGIEYSQMKKRTVSYEKLNLPFKVIKPGQRI
jgi:hypothetical protein